MSVPAVRASSLNIALRCPGAPALLGRLPHNSKPGLEALDAGTRMHGHLQRAVETGEVHEEIAELWPWVRTFAPVDVPGARCEVAVEALLDGVGVTGHLDLLACDGEEVVVVDWKYGGSHRWFLPPIGEDLQMMAYAFMAEDAATVSRDGCDYWKPPAGLPVRVQRARLTDLEVDEVVLGRRELESARELVEAVAADVAARPEVRTPGPHCDRCLAREMCAERHEAVERISGALVPYAGGALELTADQALRWALARKPLEERVKALDAALKRMVEGGLELEHDGQRLGLAGGSVETVADAPAALTALIVHCGAEVAYRAMQTSKGAIEEALRASGMKRKQIDGVLEELRGLGVLVRGEREKWLRWKRA